MKKLILLFIILFTTKLFAQHFEAKYIITYGSFLNLGEAIATLNIDKNHYKIRMEAKTTGTAKYLTNNRVEIYESSGKIIDNDFVPNKYIKIKKNDYKQRIKTYTFDHINKKIHVNIKNFGKKKIVDNKLKHVLKEFSNESNNVLPYFAKDDLLSLFFDMHKKMINLEKGKEYTFKAVGANKKTGRIDIKLPKKEQANKIIAYINQNIFGSKRGELFITLNKEGFCNKAILKDVLLFGDIVGEMTEFKNHKG